MLILDRGIVTALLSYTVPDKILVSGVLGGVSKVFSPTKVATAVHIHRVFLGQRSMVPVMRRHRFVF